MLFKRLFSLSGGLPLLALMGLAYVLFMLGNGQVTLTHPDEVFYAQTAREMLAHHSWLTPFIFDAPQFEKPILFYWLLAFGFKMFGAAPFVARFWPALFGMLGVLLTYQLAWMMFRQRRTAFLSGLVLTTSLIYIAMSRAVLTDMVFSVWILAALTAFYFSYTRPDRKTIGVIGFFVFMGLAVLTKGLLGLCFPLTTVLLFLFWKREIRFLVCPAALWGGVLFLAISVPWHVVMWQWYGSAFTQEYFHNVHIRRLLEAEHRKNDTWFFYLAVMVAGMMPWAFFYFQAMVSTVRRLRSAPGPVRDAWGMLFIWMGVVLLFLLPAHSKLASYILPLFPAQAILIGSYLDRAMPDRDKMSRGVKVGGYLYALFLTAGAAAGVIAAGHYRDFFASISPVYIIAGLLVLCALGLMWALRRRAPRGVLVGMGALGCLVFVALMLGRQDAEPWVSCEPISRMFNQLKTPPSTLLTSKFFVRGVRYYTDRSVAVIDVNGHGFFSPHPIPFLTSYDEIAHFLDSQPETYGIVKHSHVTNLKEIAAHYGYTFELLGESGGKFLVRLSRQKISGNVK